MIGTTTHKDSEESLMDQLYKLTDAGGSVLQVRTREPVRAALALRKHLLGSESPYNEWDIVNGWRRPTKANYTDHTLVGQQVDFVPALMKPLEDLRDRASILLSQPEKVNYFVYIDPQPYMKSNPYVVELIQQYAAILPSTNACIILVTDDAPLQDIPVGLVLTCDLPTPSAAELEAVLTRVVEDALKDEDSFPEGSLLEEEDVKQIAHLGLGLSQHEFETYTAISVIESSLSKDNAITADRLLAGIGQGKTAVIRQSEILELTATNGIGEVGGMQRLKDWVEQRKDSYSEEAREFGVEPPKGAALVGVPGTGKSLVAKAIASVFGVPLVRLDFGRVFSKYVGDSESRVRAALKMVESMAPCVLFVDEIDKGLGGAGGGGDSGTSSRVLGSFLTWLQENQAPVFTMVTANRVEGLPPELLRRGRFDQIFSVGMPNAISRREVLSIHLSKRKRSIDDFSAEEIQQFIAKSDGYVPAEIESAVKDAITAAFNDKSTDKLEMRHVIAALNDMVPMSKSHAETIARIVQWANVNATSVEYTPESPDPRVATGEASTAKSTARVIRPRRS